MKIKLDEAEQLVKDGLRRLGYNAEDTDTIAHHLIDSELRGYGVAGLARVLSIADKLGGKPAKTATKITREAPATAQIDGQDTLGYLVAHQATSLAIEKAKKTGVACVGANGTWYTGMLAYYAEMAAKEDLVAVIASNCTAWVAPEGGYKPMFGTNPWCVGFPSSDVPVLYDIGTSRIIHADIKLAQRLGRELPPDSAYDTDGHMTTDPFKAMEGAMRVWGGFKGSGLAITVQLLGVLAGSPALPPNLEVTLLPNLYRVCQIMAVPILKPCLGIIRHLVSPIQVLSTDNKAGLRVYGDRHQPSQFQANRRIQARD